MSESCGCKIEQGIEELGDGTLVPDGGKTVYCPRHSPERVERLEDVLKFLLDYHVEPKRHQYNQLIARAQEALKLDK